MEMRGDGMWEMEMENKRKERKFKRIMTSKVGKDHDKKNKTER